MVENTDDLKKIIELCRKSGVKTLKHGEFSIELAPEALFPESDYKKKKKDEAMKESQPDPIAEAEKVMFWSTGTEVAQ